ERNEHEDEHTHHDEHVKHERHDEHEQETEHAHHDEHEEHSDHHGHDHPPLGTVTAILVGLDSPGVTLQVQRQINEYTDEALLAILPGFTLAQLWSLVGGVENVLRGISVLVFISALFGLNAMMLASMRERKREIEILRSIGAPSLFIVALLVIESLLVVTLGIVLALAGLIGAILVANNLLASELGIMLSLQVLYSSSFIALALIYLTTLILSLVPAWRAYAVAHSYSSGVEIN
ncbi:MAG: ABC transporter permease, partial [Pseudomonadota bacterium]|nr:ABC transporter permease [Pseudomonadota bacterium]